MCVEGGVHRALDGRHAAEARAQPHTPCPFGDEAFADRAVDADIGSAEPVDRLLRIAHDEERARPHPSVHRRRVVIRVVGRGEEQQQLRLQRVGVLELVHEQVAEAPLEVAPYLGVVAHEVARLDEQVEEVHGTGPPLAVVVKPNRGAERLVHLRGQVRVGGVPERHERIHERVAGGDHLGVRQLLRELPRRAAPGPQIALLPGQRAERAFPAVVVGLRPPAQRLDVGPDAADAFDGARQRVARTRRLARRLAERRHAIEQMFDVAIAREALGPCPRRGMVAPLEQLTAGPLQARDRRIVVFVLAEAPHGHAPERAPHAFARGVEFALQPVGEGFVEEARGLPFGEHGERRIDARLHGPLAQQVGAEAVDRADVRFLEALHGAFERRGCLAGGGGARVFELLAQPQLEFAGRLFRERDGHDLVDGGAAGFDEAHDALHEFGRLAGAGGGFDHERRVERVTDERAIGGVGDGRPHGILRSASRSGTSGLRFVRAGSSGPHTARKSQ